MRAGRGTTPYGSGPGAPVARPPSVPYSESRLTQVIEESLLGPRPPAPALGPEGLACPRGRLTPKDLCSPPMVGSRPPSSNSKASVGSLHTPSPVPMSEMDERHHQRHQQQQEMVAAQAFLQHQASLISGPGLLAGHPQAGLVSSSGIPHTYVQGGLVPTSSLILQHPPANLGMLSHNTRRPGDEARRWQDEISHGFERLVALASKVDKRKRSEGDQAEHQKETNQPNQGHSIPLCNPSSTPYIPCPVNSMSLHFKKKYFAQQYQQAQHHGQGQEQGSSQVQPSQDHHQSQNYRQGQNVHDMNNSTATG